MSQSDDDREYEELRQVFNAAGWAACTTPDCGNLQCTWAGLPFCYPCSERRLGKAEMDRRYDATHERTLEQLESEIAAYGEDNVAPNPMTGIYGSGRPGDRTP